MGEKIFWKKAEFVKPLPVEPLKRAKTELPTVRSEDFINQNTDQNFGEFESQETIRLTGYNAEVMRPHGCGISAVYMALRTIGSGNFKSKYDSVGKFALDALSFHRNDLVQGDERIIGTPVFNLKSGWYHDALVYCAINLGGVNGFRMENLGSFENVLNVVQQQRLESGHNEVLAVVSVRNNHWRLKTERSSISTHMVLVNGFDFSEDGQLTRIRVADSYVANEPRINTWMEVTDEISKSFTGRAMFFAKK
ncbi:hypothetical protein COT44_02025 [Candidatus Shapirobacteria bacterium CG08_land_8_20_14_0_20_39_18]|uniref:Peptidase C39-like domain-containing protein n=1 Tax=Candidatus Shapirobacteria bacterium CG08_land_8_20_14_0_20_39_18 TaxID=1974883 RepID=A0A2M6XD86_9BACT|nr:MAG: hypothetical protein COT44_02025 [Candidatus Shapirobacteria bacterium CG08_land_8_20_14_0_20_39_18]PIY66018.1 MAG: hypothetical protein COY91_00925 [Candidatus Shapirobacteria bacterium CG_4_10_14_0_8_um_filter_39_15]PJE67875.1 MAG: hypothetical protein COU94_04905 [Candidatus Shapirobacteria bacterium CG10_big_fil_rev_8_21_14_0_10_38_8]